MRIVVANWNDRVVGGAESYLAAFLPVLAEDGVELAFWSELSSPDDRPSVIPTAAPHWSAEELGAEASFAALEDWRPDLIYAHGFTDPALEARLLAVAPSVFFAHNYYGTCITGGKTNHRPVVRPCGRIFGPACLGHFYPKRCGGLSPITMIRNYRVQSARNRLMPDYLVVLCASSHMRDELIRHGLREDRVRLNPYPVPAPPSAPGQTADPPGEGQPWRVLFAARMEAEKGAEVLLDAADSASRQTKAGIELTLGGDGRERPTLEARASQLTAANPKLTVRFPGWLDRERLAAAMDRNHLLAFPSLWPEPFGIVGVEAGHRGLPAVGFDAGGVSDWLTDGVNGTLAAADPPTSDGFAAALFRAMDAERYPTLASGARSLAARFTMELHRSRFWDALAEAGFSRPASSPTDA